MEFANGSVSQMQIPRPGRKLKKRSDVGPGMASLHQKEQRGLFQKKKKKKKAKRKKKKNGSLDKQKTGLIERGG